MMLTVVGYIAATALHGLDQALNAPGRRTPLRNGRLHAYWWSRSQPTGRSCHQLKIRCADLPRRARSCRIEDVCSRVEVPG